MYAAISSNQQVMEIFNSSSPKKTRKRNSKHSTAQKRRLLSLKLREVIYGQCPAIKVYSKKLQTDLWFVNEGLVDPLDKTFGNKVITTEKLAELMTGKGSIMDKVLKEMIGDCKQDV